jgi:hypothetical protein
MDKIIKCLSILILGMFLAGCAQASEPGSEPTLLPLSDTPTATPMVGAGDVASVQEPSPAPTQEPPTPTIPPTASATPIETATSSPTPIPKATATPEEPTETPVPLTYEPATAEPSATLPAATTAPSAAETATLPPLPSTSGSTADLVDRGLIMDVTGVASMYAWAIEWPEPRSGLPIPAHLLLTFDNHEQTATAGKNIPRLAIFPMNTYLAVVNPVPGGQAALQGQLDRLRRLLEVSPGGDGAPEGWMPLLPPPATPVEDWSDFARIDFVHGRGLRYLRVEGGELVYTYLGLTDDDSYAATLTWPLGADDAPLPEALDTMVATLALGVPPVESP